MNLSVFDDVSQDRELVGSSVLTAPAYDSNSSNNKSPGGTPINPIIPVEGFGEDLSVGKLLKNSFSKDSHATITSQNVISFADMVKCELQDKQKMIDGLLDEVKEKGSVSCMTYRR
jgi:hypothetical protein